MKQFCFFNKKEGRKEGTDIMKDFIYKLPNIASVDLMVIADLHIGDPLVAMRAVQQRLDYAAKHDNCFVILNGDLINNAVKTSISDIYSEIHSPQQAIDKAVELLSPLAQAGKILCITDGNHERRTYRNDGISPTHVIADRLGITDRLTDTSACLHLTVGKQAYTVYCTHGSGGGRMVSGKMLKLDRLADIVDADVYIMSHVHQPGAYRRGYFRIKNGKSTLIEKLFVLTAATLGYGGYADLAGMQPPAVTNPIVTLSGTQHFACALV